MAHKVDDTIGQSAGGSSGVDHALSKMDADYPNPNAAERRARRAADAMWKKVRDDIKKLDIADLDDEID